MLARDIGKPLECVDSVDGRSQVRLDRLLFLSREHTTEHEDRHADAGIPKLDPFLHDRNPECVSALVFEGPGDMG